MKEKEIRTPQFNLLLCKMIMTEERELVLELKNGKRVEQLPLEALLAEINEFMRGDKLHIVVE